MKAARRLDWALLGAVMAAAAALVLWAGRETTFFYDDWPYVLDRGEWSLDAFLQPHNEHLQAVSVLIYKVLFETVGLHHYGAYRAVLAVLDVATGVLLFAYARPRVGRWPALALAASLVVMSMSWYNLIYAFQVNFVAGMAAGLGALLALDRGTRRGDAAASLLLCVAVASSSVAFPFLAGALIEVLLRRDRLARLWVPGVPVLLYGAWRVAYGAGGGMRASNLDAVPAYVLDGLDDSVAAIAGIPVDWAAIVAVALVAFVGRELVDPARVSPRLVALAAMPLALWTLTALGRADVGVEADANRYLYASGLFVALAAVEAARRHPLTGRAGAIAGALLGFGALANAAGVEVGGDVLRAWSSSGKDAATALDIARGRVAPSYSDADPTQNFIVAGRYYAAVDRYGSSPGYTVEELLRAPEERRAGVDATLLRVLGAGMGPVDPRAVQATQPPAVDSVFNGEARSAGRGCLRLLPASAGANLAVRVPARGLFVLAGSTGVQVRVRRFASAWPADPWTTIDAGASGGLYLPPDRAPQPWRVELRADAPFRVCAFGTGRGGGPVTRLAGAGRRTARGR